MRLLDELLQESATVPAIVMKDAYDNLPESIRMYVTRNEWMWLSDREKHELVATECEPPAITD